MLRATRAQRLVHILSFCMIRRKTKPFFKQLPLYSCDVKIFSLLVFFIV